MDLVLDAAEARVLGSLMEKEIATPDYYPLSLNALVNACNQKSNREPVVAFDEETVEAALEGSRTVAIAGTQTAVYPLDTPGGWHLIGRTTVVMFDVATDPPARLAVGDTVRFVPA